MSDADVNDFDEELEEVSRKGKKAKDVSEGSNQVLIRATPESHQRWKDAAAKLGVSMAEFVRSAADKAASELLDCPHPVTNRRWYPWSETCLKCGNQLRNDKVWLVDPNNIPHVRPFVNSNPAVRK